jgi:hypothetical protein
LVGVTNIAADAGLGPKKTGSAIFLDLGLGATVTKGDKTHGVRRITGY